MYRFVEEENKIKVLKREKEGNYKVDYDFQVLEVKEIYLKGKKVNKSEILGTYFNSYKFENGILIIN